MKPRPPEQTEAPDVGLFSWLALVAYMWATWPETLYRWLHGGYMKPGNNKRLVLAYLRTPMFIGRPCWT